MDRGQHFDELKKRLLTETVGALNPSPQLEISIHGLVSAWQMLVRGLAVLSSPREADQHTALSPERPEKACCRKEHRNSAPFVSSSDIEAAPVKPRA